MAATSCGAAMHRATSADSIGCPADVEPATAGRLQCAGPSEMCGWRGAGGARRWGKLQDTVLRGMSRHRSSGGFATQTRGTSGHDHLVVAGFTRAFLQQECHTDAVCGWLTRENFVSHRLSVPREPLPTPRSGLRYIWPGIGRRRQISAVIAV